MSTGLADALHAALRDTGRREALVQDGHRLTGEQILTMTAAAAARLTASGLRPGDTIVCLRGPEPETHLSRIAALTLGCRYVHASPGVPLLSVARAMRALRPAALLYAPSRQADAETLNAAHPTGVRHRLDADLFGGTPPARPKAPGLGTSDDTSWITFSSGTTGEPKIIETPYRAEAAHLAAARAMFGATPWRFLIVRGANNLTDAFVLWTLATGGTAVLAPDDRPATLAALIGRERVTHLMAGRPPALYALADHLDASPAPLDSLRLVVYGGAAAAPARVALASDVLGPVLMQNYGTSEGGFLTALTPEDHARPHLLASAGRPVPGVELRIRDERGRDLPQGQPGEVWVRSPQRMNGYLDDTRRTPVPSRDGWLRTGDLGRLDLAGYLFLLDRAEDRLPHGLYSRPIENVLTAHPSVLDAAVFTAPGRPLAAAIVPRNGHHPDLDELRTLVRTTLGPPHEPKTLHILPELPTTPTGKPDKQSLTTHFT